MYTFDMHDRSLTLKPEGTAGVVRALTEHGLFSNGTMPLKLFYYTSCFRYEAPQSGRLREHHQFGVEYFGTSSPAADAELISLAHSVLTKLGIKNLSLQINSIGCPNCRKVYLNRLREYFSGKNLCQLCNDRLERNPMRILDCKNPDCQTQFTNVPLITDYLCDDCNEHFSGVQKKLTLLGIEYAINPLIVRGLDYYTNTVFEFIPKREGSQTTVCAGGRYNGLAEQLGGPPTAGLGFGMGIERVILEIEKSDENVFGQPKVPEIFIASADENGADLAAKLTEELRGQGISAENDISGRSLKAQMKYADKTGAKFTVVIGTSEIENCKGVLKNMLTGGRSEVRLEAACLAAHLSGK
jgi:histidyl-tRNA synthetase